MPGQSLHTSKEPVCNGHLLFSPANIHYSFFCWQHTHFTLGNQPSKTLDTVLIGRYIKVLYFCWPRTRDVTQVLWIKSFFPWNAVLEQSNKKYELDLRKPWRKYPSVPATQITRPDWFVLFCFFLSSVCISSASSFQWLYSYMERLSQILKLSYRKQPGRKMNPSK